MASAMNLLAFSLLGTAALTGFIRFKPRRVLGFAVVSLVLLALLVFSTKQLLNRIIDTQYHDDLLIRTMSLIEGRVEMKVYRPGETLPEPAPSPHANMTANTGIGLESGPGTMLERIRQRGVLRASCKPPTTTGSWVEAPRKNRRAGRLAKTCCIGSNEYAKSVLET
jgi:hypothetical protein